MNENSLNNKLTRLDTAMIDIRDAMSLDQTEPIETIHELLKKDAVTTDDKLESKILRYMKEYKNYVDKSVEGYEIIFDTPVTLYTPLADNQHYVIRRTNSTTYYIMWYKLNGYLSHSLSSYGFSKIGIVNSTFFTPAMKASEVTAPVGTSAVSSGTYYQSTNTYTSLEEAVLAMQDPTTPYTKKSGSTSKLSIDTEGDYHFSATNMPAMKFNGEQAKARRISKDETIEVIPTIE